MWGVVMADSRYHVTSKAPAIPRADRKTELVSPHLHIPHVFSAGGSQIPYSYTKQTSNGKVFLINKGVLNKYRLRPAILNEHCESSRTIQAVVDANTIVGQSFRASSDNINGCLLTLESAEGIVIDNFESYADDAALQVVWPETTNPALLETTIVHSGAKSMNLPLDALADEWIRTSAPIDYTGYTGEFEFFQDVAYGITGAIVSVFIGDGVNTKSTNIIFETVNSWEHIEVLESAMIEDQAGTTDITAITQIGFRVVDQRPGGNAYIDNLVSVPPPGSVDLKLYHVGTDPPEDGVTALDDMTQYTELGDRGLNGGSVVAEVHLQLLGGKRLYTVKDFVAGVALEIPDNNILNKDDYYVLTINYVDTEVNVYGPDPAYNKDYYSHGYAFTAPDEATAITAIGPNNDCMFGIMSTQDAYLNTMVKGLDAAPGSLATDTIFIEDKNMDITDVIVGDSLPLQEIQAEFRDRQFLIPKGGKFEVYHNDDPTDQTTLVFVLIGYIYEPPTVWG